MSGYECEFDVVKQSDKLVVDDWEDVKSRASQTPALMFHAGELTDDDVHGNLADVIVGDKAKRETAEERIMFNPVGGSDFEFVEIQNVGGQVLDMSRVELINGVSFSFSESSVQRLEPGEIVVVVRNLEAFELRYDTSQVLVAGDRIVGRCKLEPGRLKVSRAREGHVLAHPVAIAAVTVTIGAVLQIRPLAELEIGGLCR